MDKKKKSPKILIGSSIIITLILIMIGIIYIPKELQKDKLLSLGKNIILESDFYYQEMSMKEKDRTEFDGKTNIYSKIEVKNKPIEGIVYIDSQGNSSMYVFQNDWCIIKEANSTEVSLVKQTKADCLKIKQ